MTEDLNGLILPKMYICLTAIAYLEESLGIVVQGALVRQLVLYTSPVNKTPMMLCEGAMTTKRYEASVKMVVVTR